MGHIAPRTPAQAPLQQACTAGTAGAHPARHHLGCSPAAAPAQPQRACEEAPGPGSSLAGQGGHQVEQRRSHCGRRAARLCPTAGQRPPAAAGAARHLTRVLCSCHLMSQSANAVVRCPLQAQAGFAPGPAAGFCAQHPPSIQAWPGDVLSSHGSLAVRGVDPDVACVRRLQSWLAASQAQTTQCVWRWGMLYASWASWACGVAVGLFSASECGPGSKGAPVLLISSAAGPLQACRLGTSRLRTRQRP